MRGVSAMRARDTEPQLSGRRLQALHEMGEDRIGMRSRGRQIKEKECYARKRR